MRKKRWTSRSTDCDFVGNNAAFTCPHCKRLLIVSAKAHPHPKPVRYGKRNRWFDGRRECPCGGSILEVHVSPARYVPKAKGDPPIQHKAWIMH